LCELLELILVMKTVGVNTELVARLREFIEMEARSGSMEPALITPEYVYRMWGGTVEVSEIEAALKVVRAE